MQDHEHPLSAVFSARTRQEYHAGLSCQAIHGLGDFERALTTGNYPMFAVPGICILCWKSVALRVDMLAGGGRERHTCPSCRMSNRQRLMTTLLKLDGVRHEDITGLSFPDESLDLIVSNDVFENEANRWSPSVNARGCCGKAG